MICEGNQQITINHKLVTLLCYIILQITAEMLSNCTLTGPSVWCQDYIFIISRIACLHIFKIKNMVFDWMNCHSMYGTWHLEWRWYLLHLWRKLFYAISGVGMGSGGNFKCCCCPSTQDVQLQLLADHQCLNFPYHPTCHKLFYCCQGNH